MTIRLVNIQPHNNRYHHTISIQHRLIGVCKLLYILVVILLLYSAHTFARGKTGYQHSIGNNQRQIEYYTTVINGYKYMNQMNVVVVGLIRDNYHKLQLTIDHLYSTTFIHFNSYHLIVVENDSVDQTKSYLQQLVQYDRQRVSSIVLDYNNDDTMKYGAFSDHRFIRMAELRNQYLSYIHDHYHDKFHSYNDVLVLDLDLYHGWSIDGLAHSYGLKYRTGHTDRYDILCANGIYNNGEYYDTLAYRDSIYTDTRHDDAQRDAAHKIYTLYSEPIPVDSCFGGMAIYNLSHLIATNCMYTGTDCEHVTLHQCMKNTIDTNIYINPNMLLWYGLIPDKFLMKHRYFILFGIIVPCIMIFLYIYYNYSHMIRNMIYTLRNTTNKINTMNSIIHSYRPLCDVPEESIHTVHHNV